MIENEVVLRFFINDILYLLSLCFYVTGNEMFTYYSIITLTAKYVIILLIFIIRKILDWAENSPLCHVYIL